MMMLKEKTLSKTLYTIILQKLLYPRDFPNDGGVWALSSIVGSFSRSWNNSEAYDPVGGSYPLVTALAEFIRKCLNLK